MRNGCDSIDGHELDREIYRIAGLLGIDPMPFTLRELNWMLDAKTELHRQTLDCVMEGMFQAMANQMALLKALHTGRRVHPDEFYKSQKRKTLNPHHIPEDGFAIMKALFVN
jgi:hypothetical protein